MYIALVHKEPGSDFGVSFPDLPGCISAGGTAQEAIAEARSALSLHLKGLTEDGEAIPVARSVDELEADEEYREDKAEAVLVTPVSPSPLSGVTTRINVSIDTGALAQIDRAADRAGATRSRYMVQSALECAR